MREKNIDLKMVKQLFDACIDLPTAEREQQLTDSKIPEDALTEVRRLLALYDSEAEEDQHTNIITRQLQELSHNLPQGLRLGPYQIEREIGRGGMGIVFCASRADGNFEQQVAIKIAPSFASARELQHFHQERQILATLQHPHIAMLLDGGTTQDQRPYLVMEYVDGQPISEYCRKYKLNLETRLRLFSAVCEAVSFAHSHLIVHRDIKPDNVLVTTSGQVKLLDFGISKVLQSGQQATQKTLMKGLTLAYASPEQVRGESTTTATDVYGLGTLLYHLLSGQAPHPDGDSSAEKIIESICLTAPPAPSRILKGDAPAKHRNQLKGDLDNIVGKALRKEPENRYGSVSELQADVERYLRSEPVQATPPSFLYRSGKLISRYPMASALSLTVFLAVSGGFASAMYLADQLRDERDSLIAAQEEITKKANTARRTTDLLIDMFDAASPENAQGRTVNVDDLVQAAVANTRTSNIGEPEVKAQLLSTLAQVKFNTGKYLDAAALEQEALTLTKAQTAKSQHSHHAEITESLIRLGHYLQSSDQIAQAEKVFDGAQITLGSNPDARLQANYLSHRARLVSKIDLPEKTIPLLQRALSIWNKLPEKGGVHGLRTRHSLSNAYFNSGDFQQAAAEGESVLTDSIRLLGKTHPDTLNSYRHLARCYMRTGQWQAALT